MYYFGGEFTFALEVRAMERFPLFTLQLLKWVSAVLKTFYNGIDLVILCLLPIRN